MEEITSLERERKDLIGSLTPGISRWVDALSGTPTSSSVRDKVKVKVDCNEPLGEANEDLQGFLQIYRAGNGEGDGGGSRGREEEEEEMKEEKKKRERMRKKEKEKKKKKQQQHKEKDDEDKKKKGYRTDWEYSSGSKPGQCGEFEDKIPCSLRTAYPVSSARAVIESTLQIYSFKITGLSDDLKWPLNVYGVIAARDTVDQNRNLLFSRSSIMRQVLTSENDCSLCLTGPSRAILAMDPVDFEVELRVHDGCDPRGDGLNDRELIYVSSRYEVAPSADLVGLFVVFCDLQNTFRDQKPLYVYEAASLWSVSIVS
ncbi:hypothetical protein ZWY2020_039144 [Hordeum vulgare]|nr:hypothetical protein ZWY2020_039144 [Hordeum vulgare]